MAMAAGALAVLAGPAGADEGLWKRLQHEHNMIVLMRNAASQGAREGVDMLAWDPSGRCAGESTLTEAGRDHARRIGVAFAKRGIRPLVVSSPMCRCAQTAELAFGTAATDPALRQRRPGDAAARQQFLARAKSLLARHRGAAPIAFVNHRPNIDAMTLELIGIGDLLVGTVSDQGDVDIVGTIRVD